jgi:hypothetical protein
LKPHRPNPIDRELPAKPESACPHLYKDRAQYRTARDIWICTKDDRFSEVSREKGKKCLAGKWCNR